MLRDLAATDFDLHVPSGRLRAHRFGDPADELVLCAPGLSANSRWFDYLGERIAGAGRQVVVLDLRGRGNSDVTGPGTYGYKNHALDVFAAAEALGVAQFDFIGHSMGAYVGMEAAALATADKLRRVILIDGLGTPRLAAVQSILNNLRRLDRVFASEDEYVDSVRSLHLAEPWSDYWERCYRYELVAVPGGFRARTQRGPIREDIAYGTAHDARKLWGKISMPVLALRALRSISGRSGFIVTEFDLRNFARKVPSATTLEIDANHYGIMMHSETLAAVRRFLT